MFNRRRLMLVAAAAACLFVATGASANPLDTFTGVAAPSYVKPSSTTSFSVALTNDALSPDAAHRATVGIPLGFSVAPASVQATTTAVAGSCDASTWVADGAPIADQKIHLMRPGGDITALCPGATLTVTFTATSGAVDGAFAWTSELLNDVSGAFTLSGPQPGVVVDGTNPTVTLGGKPSNPSNDPSPSFTFSANETSTFECKLDAGALTACTSPRNYPALADGAHSFTVRATDAAGNFSEASHSWTIDTVAPTVTLSGKPPNPSNDTSPTFTFSTGETATFECKLDGGAFASCSSPQIYPALGNGPHTFTIKATDAANNVGQASYTWTIDTVAPTANVTDKPANPSNVKSPSFAFTATEPSTFDCKLDQNAVEACSSPKSYSNLADGAHTFAVRAKDAAGNTGSSTYSWVIDTAPPTATIGPKPANPSSDSTPSFGFTAGESATFECKLDGGAFAACSPPKTLGTLPDGAHTFTVRATDPAGNTGAEASYTWTIDTVAPAATIATKPSNPSNNKSPSFTFSAGEPSSFQCKLDAGAAAACTSPQSYADLADGAHTFIVRATDQAGNAGATTSYTWTIDTVAPTTTITSKPDNPTSDKSPTFAFTAGEPSTFQCKLDGGALSPCTSPQNYGNLAGGAHTFAAKATDLAGNAGAEASYAWTIDTVNPIAAITSQPSNPTNDKSPTFAFNAGEPSTFQCKLDGAAFAACTSPLAYGDQGDGAHTFIVRATDKAGNTGPDASYTWTIDTTAPTVAITNKPSNPSNTSFPSFTFAASETGTTLVCRLDGAAFAACTSPTSYANLGEVAHTFVVKAADAAGNTGPEATYTWMIDTTAPIASITSQPSNPSSVKSPSFAFAANEAGTFECKLDAAAFAACVSPKGYTNLGDGSHTFTVRAIDGAGNVGVNVGYTWAIDATGPIVTITQKPADPTTSQAANVGFTANEQATFQCKLDAAAFAACTSPKGYSGLAEGSHTFAVKATDALNNAGLETTYTWRIDITPPMVAITAKPTNPSNDSAPSFAFTASEGGSTFSCRLEGGGFSPCSSPKAYSGLTDGSHSFGVKATDAAGNTGPETSVVWSIDTVAPTALITQTPDPQSGIPSASFSFTAAEGGSMFACKLDAAAFAPCTSPTAYGGLGDGPHAFAVKATDAAGNSGSEAAYGWTIETRAPTAAVIAGPSGLTNSSAATFSFSADEPSSFDCKVDGASFEPCSSPATYHGLGDGGHGFSVRARDAVGNFSAPASQSWTIDTTAPDTTISSAPKSGTATSATFAFSASEGGSFECRLDDAPFAVCASPKSYSPLRPGDHRFEVRAVDAAGNADPTPALHGWKVDVTVAKVTSTALLSPTAGTRVTKPPLLVWRRVARARYYNVQIYRRGVKVFTGWPTRARLQLKTRWKLQGKVRKLTPGTYRWYVWPGYGVPATRRYGALLGQSTFIVTKR
jgi:large repetitive protein